MNKVIITGNLTRDPELTQTPNGTVVCKFTVAVNRGFGDNRTADYYNVFAWRRLGEAVAQHTWKGSKVAVIGDIQQRFYEGNDGVKRLTVDVQASDVEFLTPKQKEDEFYNASSKPSGTAQKKQIEMFDDDGDIPF